MNDYKSLFMSKTFWGAVITVFAFFIPWLNDPNHSASVVNYVVLGAGFLLTVVGRYTATKKVTLTGRPPDHEQPPYQPIGGPSSPVPPDFPRQHIGPPKNRHRGSRFAIAMPLFAGLLFITAMVGCPKDKYQKAAVAGRDFAVAVRAIQQTEEAFACRAATTIQPCTALIAADENAKFQTAFGETAKLGKEIDDTIRAGNAATDKDIQALVKQGLASTQKLLEQTQLIKDDKAKVGIIASILAARIILNNVEAALGGAQ